MKLTIEQNDALNKISKWIKNTDQQVFCLGGYAGTGKTTVLQELINNLDIAPVCCAPTGKAASVLKKKLYGAIDVRTIHKVLYNPRDRSKAKLIDLQVQMRKNPADKRIEIAYNRELKKQGDVTFSLKDIHEVTPNRIVIIDESSMVTGTISTDIINTGAKILFVGDPGQLPPVGDEGYFNKSNKDFILQQIHRQALGSPITALASAVRLNELAPPKSDKIRCVGRGVLQDEDYLNAGQILCGKNITRRKMNKFIRKKLGKSSVMPTEGEKIICLKNKYQGGVSHFINGVDAITLSDARWDEMLQCFICVIMYDGKEVPVAFYDYHFKLHYDSEIEPTDWREREGQAEFDYGYAITVHKSQGSEWDNIIICDDGFKANDHSFRRKWLYTAITRAKDSLIWIK